MSTVDKLIYLNTTKTKLRNVINITGANLTEENTFRSYASNLESKLVDIINNGTDTLYNNFPKVVETGSDVELDNTYSSKMSVILNADTKQRTTTGKNLLNVNNPNTASGITTTYNALDGSLNIRGTATTTGNIQLTKDIPLYLTAGKTYTFSIDKPLTDAIYIHGYDENDSVLNIQISTGKKFKTSTLSRNIVRYNMRYPVTNGTTYNLTIKCQVEEGAEATEYEPYTGTIPGPNPDYPQKVQVITGSNNIKISNSDNTEEQNYPITLSSKNLLNFNNIDITRLGNEGTVSVNGNVISFTATGQQVYGVQINLAGLKLKNNTTYTVSNLMSNTDENINSIGWRYYNGSSYTNLNYYKTHFTFTTTTSGVNTILYYIGTPASYNGTLTLSNIQLLEGNIAEANIPTYEPYYNIKYCKIGDYEDQFIRTSGKNLFDIEGNINTRYNGTTGNYNTIDGTNLITTYSTNNGYPYGQRIYVGTGKKVTISGVVSNINSTGSKSALIMCFNDNTTTGVQSVSFADTEINTRKSLTFTADTDYIIVTFAGRYNGFVSATFTDIQVEYGETATEYDPYGLNEWYLKKNIGKVTFDGSDDEVYEKVYGSIYNNKCIFYLRNIPHNNSNYRLMKSNRFVATAGVSEYYPEGINTSFNTGYLGLVLSADRLTDYSSGALKVFFQNNNTDVYLIAQTPTYIHISKTDYPTLKGQLDNLYNNATSYDEQTNIIQTNDDLPFILNISALAKTE